MGRGRGRAKSGQAAGILANRLDPADRAVHDWYRFVLSFPPHLVRSYLGDFGLAPDSTVLDPFCGTGTTLVEGKRQGYRAVGCEPLPMANFASEVKTDWSPDGRSLFAHARAVAEQALDVLRADGMADGPSTVPPEPSGAFRDVTPEKRRLLFKNAISPAPLHKALALHDVIKENFDARSSNHELLALARILPTEVGNLRFGPEVGVGAIKSDAAVVLPWLGQVKTMADDLARVDAEGPDTQVLQADAREVGAHLPARSVEAVITSPPYPNEKDYTRTTRLESVLLGFYADMAQLRVFKKELVRSNTRSVYVDDDDDQWVREYPEIARIARKIERRRREMGKTSGFERLYHRVTTLYFGGMKRHLDSLRDCLAPGAQLAYVVGDQASYLQVMIRTGRLLAQLAEGSGYEVVRTDLFRTRAATATKSRLREDVVVLRWPG